MSSKLKKINAELAKQINYILSARLQDHRINALLTVTKVTVDTELSYAKVYLSILPFDKDQDKNKIIEYVQSASNFIRNELKTLINIRNIPVLAFHLDQSTEYAIKIDKILKESKEKNK